MIKMNLGLATMSIKICESSKESGVNHEMQTIYNFCVSEVVLRWSRNLKLILPVVQKIKDDNMRRRPPK